MTLQPTVWRTCRVLASLPRLRLFAALIRQQPQTVSGLAEQAGLSLPLASISLRALESRGLLSVRRVRRHVQYRIAVDGAETVASKLAKALKNIAKGNDNPLAVIFRAATGFTHPARVEIYCQLAAGPKNKAQLAAALQLSQLAVARHLRKLETRGYIAWRDDCYELAQPPNAAGQVLAELALQGGNITLLKV